MASDESGAVQSSHIEHVGIENHHVARSAASTHNLDCKSGVQRWLRAESAPIGSWVARTSKRTAVPSALRAGRAGVLGARKPYKEVAGTHFVVS